jgi:hypothetical protein
MGNLIASVLLILTFLGLISLGCLVAGVVALFDGSPLWFAFMGLALGVMGLLCTHYHLMLAYEVYKKVNK